METEKSAFGTVLSKVSFTRFPSSGYCASFKNTTRKHSTKGSPAHTQKPKICPPSLATHIHSHHVKLRSCCHGQDATKNHSCTPEATPTWWQHEFSPTSQGGSEVRSLSRPQVTGLPSPSPQPHFSSNVVSRPAYQAYHRKSESVFCCSFTDSYSSCSSSAKPKPPQSCLAPTPLTGASEGKFCHNTYRYLEPTTKTTTQIV